MGTKASRFGIKGGKVGRSFATGDKQANAHSAKAFGVKNTRYTPEPVREGRSEAHAVGHNMVKSGRAQHPHWRSGKGLKHAKRMYGNADTAHAHTKVRPY